MTEAFLTLNAGSSSLKFSLFQQASAGLKLSSRGEVEGIGASPHLTARSADGTLLVDEQWPRGGDPVDHEALLRPIFAWAIDHLGGDHLRAVGHRVVHGGPNFQRPVLVDDRVLADLDALCPLAPLHQPHSLAAIRAVRSIRDDLPQVACVDTAFHSGHADVVARFALPRRWHDQGVRRYGFHGLSYEFVAGRMAALDPKLAAGRMIIAHLGAGASLCALDDGRSVDTTMGFTALDGLVMSTRCGVLDPGVVLYLQQQAGLSAKAVETLLYEQSGLLGVSGVSGDMRDLIASDDTRAKEAVDLFAFQIAKQSGALMATLGGLDGIVFTAGVGEHSAEIRAQVAERLAWTGLRLDPGANRTNAGQISAATSAVKAWVVATDEESMIAHHTWRVVTGATAAQ